MNAQTESGPGPNRPGNTPPNPQPSRTAFWVNTCRELTQMQIRSPEVMRLHQQYGCRFVPPTLTQTESVLTALDAALRGWEETHPELFFQALELNFPELVRRSPVAA